MDTRRFRNQRAAQNLERARWIAWVLMMMFVITQVAVDGVKNLPSVILASR